MGAGGGRPGKKKAWPTERGGGTAGDGRVTARAHRRRNGHPAGTLHRAGDEGVKAGGGGRGGGGGGGGGCLQAARRMWSSSRCCVPTRTPALEQSKTRIDGDPSHVCPPPPQTDPAMRPGDARPHARTHRQSHPAAPRRCSVQRSMPNVLPAFHIRRNAAAAFCIWLSPRRQECSRYHMVLIDGCYGSMIRWGGA